MVSIRTYSDLTNDDYYRITQFRKSTNQPVSYEDLVAGEAGQGQLTIHRIAISKSLAARILKYIRDNELHTRGGIKDVSQIEENRLKCSVFTVRFSLHMVAGNRGGWFVLEGGGREPFIKDEFIECGPKRKSGGRKSRYRRNLSYSEQNQVDYLLGKTPSLEQIYRWIIRKYASEVKNIEFSYLGDEYAAPPP